MLVLFAVFFIAAFVAAGMWYGLWRKDYETGPAAMRRKAYLYAGASIVSGILSGIFLMIHEL